MYLNNVAECSDSNACTSNDVCFGGKCVGGAKPDCDDKNICTIDACDAGSGCLHTFGSAPCDDGNACTQFDACINGLCLGLKKLCDDSNACTDDSCDPKNGCVYANNAIACSDGNACTSGDLCVAGKCVGGKAKDCDDANVCTQDSCIIATGQCNNIDTSAVDCNDKNACTDDLCHLVLGCGHNNNSAACADGNPCTNLDICSGGKCTAPGVVVCDDKNGCTDDSCDPKSGCVFNNNAKICSDGVGCTINDTCAGGKCAGALNCDDKNGCTTDTCDFNTGNCVYSPLNGDVCDDSNACTIKDICATGVCVGGALKVCDDGLICTDNACDKVKGCYYFNNTAGCDVGGCTLGDTCAGGTCVAGKVARLGSLYVATQVSNKAFFEPYGVVEAQGDYIVYGTVGIGAFSTPQGEYASWLARITPAGVMKWQVVEEKIGYYLGEHVRGYLDSGNNIVLFGREEQGNTLFTVKYDLNGKLLTYVTSTFGPSTSRFREIARRPLKGDVIAFGYRYFGGQFGSDDNAILARYDATDLKLYDVNVYDDKGAGSDFWGGTLQADGVSPVACGWTTEAGGAGLKDGIVAFYGPDVTKPPVKVLKFGGPKDDALRSIARTGDGGYVAAGWTESNSATRDMWVIRLNSKGDLSWQSFYQGSAADEAWHVLMQKDGSALVSGFIGYADKTNDGMLLRVDQKGGVQSLTSGPLGSTGDDLLFQITQLSGGDLLTVGRANVAGKVYAWLLRHDGYMNINCTQAMNCKTPLTLYSDGNVCNFVKCDATFGLSNLIKSGALCSDGDACTTTDTCQNNASCSGIAVVCDDANPCTFETCDKALGCVYTAAVDGLDCGGGKKCKASVCQ